MSQSKISRFFPSPTKRGRSPESSEPPFKKKKTGLTQSNQSRERVERWRFNDSDDSVNRPSSSTSARVRKAFKEKLSKKHTLQAPEPIEINSESDTDHAFDELHKFFAESKGKKGKNKPAEEIGPSGEPYTPLEKQVLRLKKDNQNTVLMVEVGYKYKFFGEDAKIAAKELGMICHPDRNFLVASIPTHRQDIHLKKLLSQGYRVGIVQQVETAALKKAGDNKSGPFERKLVQLCTASTYVDALDSTDESDKYSLPRLVCVIEKQNENSPTIGSDVSIGVISVSPSDGDVVWDAFEDTPMRIELETRLAHSQPTELLVQQDGLSKATGKMLQHFAEVPTTGAKVRTEYLDDTMSYSEAFEYVSDFYTRRQASEKPEGSDILAAVTGFPQLVVVALACTIRYLAAFNLANTLVETKFFTRFQSKTHMLLAGNTLANLEIFQNETDHTRKGSLIWILDRTQTAFGARMLKQWVGRPLVSKPALQERIDAVEEILSSSSDKLVSLRQLLKRLPDLAKGLCRIQYKQCTPKELVILLSAFYKIGTDFSATTTPANVGFNSKILNDIIFSLPPLKAPMKQLLDTLDIGQAKEGRKEYMWRDKEKFPELEDTLLTIRQVEVELDAELTTIRKTLKMPSLKYTEVSGERYLIEVKKSENRPIPESYLPAISKTKYIERYRSPEVKLKVQELERWEESLQIEAKKAFRKFLDEVIEHYGLMRNAVQKLATADCLLSLAQVALRDTNNYVKPQFVNDEDDADTFEIVDGRHPMVEALRSDPFVPNCVSFSKEGRCKVITGPNMGGKSSSVRMIALICILAQIGSYVPAKSVKLGIFDSILSRMGAYDDIARGRSTFMVEMTETSDLLHSATPRSLVILDELGRGTSTFDGMAIAYSVLEHLVASIRCNTLFITHYPLVAAELEKKYPESIQNMHVGYHAEVRPNGRRDVSFLYKLTDGIAPVSFGVECARLAGLPEAILANATEQSLAMEATVTVRTRRNATLKKLQLLKELLHKPPTYVETVAILDKLRTLSRPDL